MLVLRPEGVHRRGELVPVRRGVRRGERALPHVGAVDAARHQLAAPREDSPLRSADLLPPRGELPLRLGRQPRADPAAVRDGVRPRDVHHRVIRAPLESIRPRPLGPSPIRAVHRDPPRRRLHRLRRRRVRLGRQLPLEHERPAEPLRVRLEARRRREGGPLRGAHLRRTHPEAGEAHAAGGALAVGEEGGGRGRPVVVPHHELSGGDPHHLRRRRRRAGGLLRRGERRGRREEGVASHGGAAAACVGGGRVRARRIGRAAPHLS
mmetsp:Transcript_23010/g.34369  ORF Transcript_23010/g.34369 Transcript_23010/m.34369 type:complete len:265 (-) Transcript_23010:99-893(-)